MPSVVTEQEIDAIGEELPELAARAIRAWVETGQRLMVDRSIGPPAPVFVTLRNPDGGLRGCIGSLVPHEADVGAETVRSAVSAASRDPRFRPVAAEELAGLRIEVSVLLPEEPVQGIEDLDPARYGVIVRDDRGRQGVLLPAITGIDEAQEQVAIARRKAGIGPDEPIALHRFRVRKFVAGREGGSSAALTHRVA